MTPLEAQRHLWTSAGDSHFHECGDHSDVIKGECPFAAQHQLRAEVAVVRLQSPQAVAWQ